MHELSLAHSLIEIATEHARANGSDRVLAVTLRIGALSCVHRSALEFSFELAAKDTPLEGAELRIIDVPIAIYCESCKREVQLPGIQRFRCPHCDVPSADIRSGKELDILTIELLQLRSPEKKPMSCSNPELSKFAPRS